MEFYVTLDRAYVDDFAVYISVPGCGNYQIKHLPLEPITGNAFSFTGTFYANGTFSNSTTCSGTTGLTNFYIPGCGYINGGPWSYQAAWQHAAQPAVLDNRNLDTVVAGPPPGEAWVIERPPQ